MPCNQPDRGKREENGERAHGNCVHERKTITDSKLWWKHTDCECYLRLAHAFRRKKVENDVAVENPAELKCTRELESLGNFLVASGKTAQLGGLLP